MGQCAVGREEKGVGNATPPKEFPYPAAAFDQEQVDNAKDAERAASDAAAHAGDEEAAHIGAAAAAPAPITGAGPLADSEPNRSWTEDAGGGPANQLAGSELNCKASVDPPAIPLKARRADSARRPSALLTAHVDVKSPTPSPRERLTQTYRDALLMIESGAQRVFGWVVVDPLGDELAGQAGFGEFDTRSLKGARGRFCAASRMLCPSHHSWDEPLHYICYMVFPGVTSARLFQALHCLAERATWDLPWQRARALGTLDATSDVIYTCFPSENRVLRAMGLNFDFVDKRTVFRDVQFPQTVRVPEAYGTAWRASRLESRRVDDALQSNSFRFEHPSRFAKAAQEPVPVASEWSAGGARSPCRFQRVQPTPPAAYVVVLEPTEHVKAPKRRRFERCSSMPPSGYVIRDLADAHIAARDPASCLIRGPGTGGTAAGARLTLVSRSSIQVPLSSAVSRRRLHVMTMDNFAAWRTALERELAPKSPK